MIFFILSSFFFVAGLVLIKPAPISLKAAPLTYRAHSQQIYGTLLSGLVLLFVFLLTSNFNFIDVDDQLYQLFALNNMYELSPLWIMQSFTHLLIHTDFIHLLSNVFALALVSGYERRVGTKRFFVILTVGSLASIPSILFYTELSLVCGISGGVAGLAAAYFLDEDKLTIKEWLIGISAFFGLMLLLSLGDIVTEETDGLTYLQIDYIGHVLGALGVILYCRFRPFVAHSL